MASRHGLVETGTLTLISRPSSIVHSILLYDESSNPTRTDGSCRGKVECVWGGVHTHTCAPIHTHTITLFAMPTLSAILFSFVSVCGYGSGRNQVGNSGTLGRARMRYLRAHACTRMRGRTVHARTYPDGKLDVRFGAFLVAHALRVPEVQ